MQHDQCTLLGFEPSESALDLISVRDRGCGVGRCGKLDLAEWHVQAVTTRAARLVNTQTDEEAV
jgi:hypothetical protein